MGLKRGKKWVEEVYKAAVPYALAESFTCSDSMASSITCRKA